MNLLLNKFPLPEDPSQGPGHRESRSRLMSCCSILRWPASIPNGNQIHAQLEGKPHCSVQRAT